MTICRGLLRLPMKCIETGSPVMHLELHRRAVESAGAQVPDARMWREGFNLAARDLLVNRFSLNLMAHAFRHYGFLERSLRTLRRLVDLDLERR